MSNQTLLQHFSIGSRIGAATAEKECASGNLLTAMNSTARKLSAETRRDRQSAAETRAAASGLRHKKFIDTSGKGFTRIRFTAKEWLNFVNRVT